MPQFHSKNSHRKFGLNPGYTPQFHDEPTDEAKIPMFQRDGSLKYLSEQDFKWLVDHNLIDSNVLEQ